jgi:hypothetical protein
LDAIAARLADRAFTLEVDAFRSLDAERRAALTEAEALKAHRNAESQEIAKLRKAGQDTTERQQKVREAGDQIAALDEKAKALDDRFRELLAACRTLRTSRSRPARAPRTTSRFADGAPRPRFRSLRRRIGISGRNWGFWISSAREKSRAHDSRSTWDWERSSSAH